MWLCFNKGFVSVIADKNDRNRFVVRARNREHLEELFPAEAEKITQTDNSDYAFRLFLPREKVIDLVTMELSVLDYTNFKDSVENKDLKHLYEDFWFLHFKYQCDLLGEPYWTGTVNYR